MKNTITISTITILVLALSRFSTLKVQANQNQQPVEANNAIEKPEPTERPRIESVKMVNFYLKSGELISGRLITDDRNQITVEQPNQSRMIVSTYGKRDIDMRSLTTSNVLEYKYYTELAEYFSAKTWDFKDDPDDFIQAIRCYEKARQSLLKTQDKDNEKIEQIEEKIKQLQADRDVWTKQVESRAKLKQLEFEVTFETRLKDIEDKFEAHTQNINKTMADIQNNQQKLQENISAIDKNTSQQLKTLSSQLETHRRIINRMNNFWEYYPPERRE